MDIVWQKMLGITTPSLPEDFRSEHFTNAELNELIRSWGGGNSLSNPTDIAVVAELGYAFDSDEDFCADPGFQQMHKDGLARFLVALWTMVATKKNIPLPNNGNPKTTQKQR